MPPTGCPQNGPCAGRRDPACLALPLAGCSARIASIIMYPAESPGSLSSRLGFRPTYFIYRTKFCTSLVPSVSDSLRFSVFADQSGRPGRATGAADRRRRADGAAPAARSRAPWTSGSACARCAAPAAAAPPGRLAPCGRCVARAARCVVGALGAGPAAGAVHIADRHRGIAVYLRPALAAGPTRRSNGCAALREPLADASCSDGTRSVVIRPPPSDRYPRAAPAGRSRSSRACRRDLAMRDHRS